MDKLEKKSAGKSEVNENSNISSDNTKRDLSSIETAASAEENIPVDQPVKSDFEVFDQKMDQLREPANFLEVTGLEKKFGKKRAVAGIDFSMCTGEIVGLLGPNGAGKTTAFYMVVGFIQPDSGSIFLDKTDITKMPMYKRARQGITYLPQEASIFRKLTVEKNIMAVLETRNDIDAEMRNTILEQLLDEFGLEYLRKQVAYTLSGGERRRTEIARALAIEPKFLLLDEPFAGIDPIAVTDIKNIVKRLAEKGIGVLLTDHNVRDTLEITDRAYIINQGEILVSGNREDILSSEIARKIYLGETFKM